MINPNRSFAATALALHCSFNFTGTHYAARAEAPLLLPVSSTRYAHYDLSGVTRPSDSGERGHTECWVSTRPHYPFYLVGAASDVMYMDCGDVAASCASITRFTFSYATNAAAPIDINVQFYANADGWGRGDLTRVAWFRLAGLPGGQDGPGHTAWIVSVDAAIDLSTAGAAGDLDGNGLLDFGYAFQFPTLSEGEVAGPVLGDADPNIVPFAAPGIDEGFDVYVDDSNGVCVTEALFPGLNARYAGRAGGHFWFYQFYLSLAVGGPQVVRCSRPECGQLDIVADCLIDLADVATLLANYGTAGGAERGHGDIEPPGGDGDVDLSDLSVLLGAYGQDCQAYTPLTCPPPVIIGPELLVLGLPAEFKSRDFQVLDYSWEVSAGAERAVIVGSSHKRKVRLQATQAGVTPGDVTLTLHTTTGDGRVETTSKNLTVVSATPLKLRLSGVWDSDNETVPSPSTGQPTLGSIEPGAPPGAEGFFKSAETRSNMAFCLSETGAHFVRTRQGIVGLWSNGIFQPDWAHCPSVYWCLAYDGCFDEDLTPSPEPECAIFSTLSRGFIPGSCESENEGDYAINCLNFSEKVMLSFITLTPTLAWHATTRIRCGPDGWELDSGGNGNSIGLGHVTCEPTPLVPPAPLDIAAALAQLSWPGAASRLHGQNVILDQIYSGELSGADRDLLIGELISLATLVDLDPPLWSTPMLALRLLGELGVEDAMPLLFDRLLEEFPRPIVTDIDAHLSVAAAALARIGLPAAEAIVARVASASDAEWQMSGRALHFIADRDGVLQQIESALAATSDALAQARLMALLDSFS